MKRRPALSSHIDRAFVDRKRRFLDGLRQGGVSVAGARNVLGGGAEFHGDRRLRDHVAGVGADDVHAEHAVVFGIDEDFYETLGPLVGPGAGIGRERELCRAHAAADAHQPLEEASGVAGAQYAPPFP
jgi:hypothetical protein